MYHGVIQGCLQLQGHHPAPASSSGGQAAAAAVGQDAGQEQRFFAAAHAGAASLQQPGQQLHHPQDAHLQAQQQWDPSSSSAAAAAQEAAAAAVADPPALPLGAAADAGLLVQFFAGGCAGALAWMSIYPIDVVKSRMQVGVGGVVCSTHARSVAWRRQVLVPGRHTRTGVLPSAVCHR
jgi:hypothetical protein